MEAHSGFRRLRNQLIGPGSQLEKQWQGFEENPQDSKPFPDQDGYLEGIFSSGRRRRKYKVHIEVLVAFIGPRPDGLLAAHYDGNRQNNIPSNLRWATHKGNSDDRSRHGTNLHGEKHPDAKLTEDLVREIRTSSLTGEEWAQRLRVRRCTINKARVGTTWKHVA
jgi:hypothetical protein